MPDQDLDSLVRSVLATAKYRALAPDLVRAVGSAELAKGRKWKDALKATKGKLHQVGGAYQDGDMAYAAWATSLDRSYANPEDFRAQCRAVMHHHASTRERLVFLDDFYATLFAGLPDKFTLIDLACGHNPLAIPWMGLSPATQYIACDVYRDQIDFLNRFFELVSAGSSRGKGDSMLQRGRAVVCDLVHTPPPSGDVALLLKTLPCLEQLDKDAGRRLLDLVDASTLFVSFPGQSLGGRAKGMRQNYAAGFLEKLAAYPWRVTRYDFPNELVFRIDK